MELRPVECLEQINVDTLELIEIKSIIEHYENIVRNDKNTEYTTKLQYYCTIYLQKKYVNKTTILVSFELLDNQCNNYKLNIIMAPLSDVPYSVYFFMNIVENWEGGVIHRNAGHVKQFKVLGQKTSLAFQEYSPSFPHEKYTCGFAGRPGGPAFYINTRCNIINHGPGSQGSKTDADSCFGKIDVIDPDTNKLLERINQMKKKDKSGFVEKEQEIKVMRVTPLDI